MRNSYLELFSTFFKIGTFTFGGGYAMLPVIEREVVARKNWLTEEEFTEMLAVVQTSPGPVSVNSSVFIGYKKAGWKGSLTAALGTILPSFIIILLIAMVFSEIKDNATIEKVFKGIRPAVVALIAAPVVRMIKSSKLTWKMAYIPILAVIVIWYFNISPIYVILAAGIWGITYNLFTEGKHKNVK